MYDVGPFWQGGYFNHFIPIDLNFCTRSLIKVFGNLFFNHDYIFLLILTLWQIPAIPGRMPGWLKAGNNDRVSASG